VSVVLEVRDLSVAYGGVLAVRGVSLAVAAGRIATVIGANGAGKSTLLNAIMGILPSHGHIGFSGASLDGLPVEARVATGLGLVPEKRELFQTMSVEDNLRLGGFKRRGEGRKAMETALGEVFALFRDYSSAAASSPAPFRAASARCSQWAGR
jgi:branched-chain amino acid transport system ATP-binding protein